MVKKVATSNSKPSKTGKSLKRKKNAVVAKGQIKSSAESKTAFARAGKVATAAYSNSVAFVGELGSLTRGNLQAVVESSKILGGGLKTLGSEMVTDGRAAFETLASDVREVVAVKSPADLAKFQAKILRRNFDATVAYGARSGGALIKLAKDAAVPVSGRINVAMETFRKVA